MPLQDDARPFEAHLQRVSGEAEGADALLVAAEPLVRALVRAARFVAAAVAAPDFEAVHVPAGRLAYVLTNAYGALVWLSAAQREARGGAFAPQPAAVAALCSAAAPALDAAAAFLRRRLEPRGVGQMELEDLPLLRLLGSLLRDPLPGGGHLLAAALTTERLLFVGAPALALSRARLERRALGADEWPGAFLDVKDCADLLAAVLLRGDADRTGPAYAMAAYTATALVTLLYSRAAAAAGSGEAAAALLPRLVRNAVRCMHLLAEGGAGAPPPSWAPWALAQTSVASAALVRLASARPGAAAAELALCVALADVALRQAASLLAARLPAGVAGALGTIAAALGAATACALGKPRLEAVARRAGAALAGAPVGLARAGAMETLPPEASAEPADVVVALAAIAQRPPGHGAAPRRRTHRGGRRAAGRRGDRRARRGRRPGVARRRPGRVRRAGARLRRARAGERARRVRRVRLLLARLQHQVAAADVGGGGGGGGRRRGLRGADARGAPPS